MSDPVSDRTILRVFTGASAIAVAALSVTEFTLAHRLLEGASLIIVALFLGLACAAI